MMRLKNLTLSSNLPMHSYYITKLIYSSSSSYLLSVSTCSRSNYYKCHRTGSLIQPSSHYSSYSDTPDLLSSSFLNTSKKAITSDDFVSALSQINIVPAYSPQFTHDHDHDHSNVHSTNNSKNSQHDISSNHLEKDLCYDYVIAVSGSMESMALAYLLSRSIPSSVTHKKRKILAVSVDYNLPHLPLPKDAEHSNSNLESSSSKFLEKDSIIALISNQMSKLG